MKRANYSHVLDLGGDWRMALSLDEIEQEYCGSKQLMNAGLGVLAAKVPGNLELDLQANGIIDDPFSGMNIASLTKYEKAHCWYFREFAAEDRTGYDAQLVFEGLDCFADIYLNGRFIGSTDNMLVEHVFNISGMLAGRNELFVHIKPALDNAKQHDYPPHLSAFACNYESLYVRKAPHMYGWDIMPRALSAGIWRPVTLRFRPVERIDNVFLETRNCSREKAALTLRYHARISDPYSDNYSVRIEGKCGSSTFSAECRALFDAGRMRFSVDSPMLWWPKGRGEANLYDVAVILLKNGEEIDRHEFNYGIRGVRLERTSITDENGCGEFCFWINGEKVFIKGSNWVPADAYHSRDAERIPQMLELADDLNCNMLRCWGGNVYENDLFYDICDRKGIMVWQDFAMACAVYPQDEDFQNRFEIEARKVVRRLRNHACVVLWSGDNECDQAYTWGGRRLDPNDNVLTRKVLAKVLCEEDGTRPYLPSSPYIDSEAYKAEDKYLSENHLWGPRDYFKSDFYRSSPCHFASEIGYHGCPSPESIRKFISPDKVWPYQDNEEWNLHSTSPVPGVDTFGADGYRVHLMANQIRALFGEVPDNLEDFAFASQVSQAEAKKFFIEFFRSTKWRRTGIIWWNIIDGWPQFSDAIVDYYFNRKLAYDFIKRSQASLCLMLREPESDAQELVACNDTREDIEMEYTLRDVGTGEVIVQNRTTARADSTTILGRIPFSLDNRRMYLIEWTSPQASGKNHYLAGTPPFDLEQYRTWMKEVRLLP